MKVKFLSALAIGLCFFTIADAQNNPFKMPPKVFPVLKENYVSANSDEVFTVGKVKGDIGKTEALYLPKPFYPGEAKRDAAEGKIYVKVSIDDKGNVVSANSTDGHPALRKIAEETALVSKFRAPQVDNQAVKSEGWLIYNFEIAKSNWLKVGYDLAFLHSPFNNQKLALAGMKRNFKANWATEKEMLARLEEYVAQMPRVERPETVPALESRTNNKGFSSVSSSIAIRLPTLPEPNPEQIAVTQNLIAALQSRLAGDEIASWQFNLAFAILQEAFPRRGEPIGNTKSPDILKSFLNNAPQNLPAEYKTELANLIELIETDAKRENFDKDNLEKIQNSVIRLQKLN